MRPLPIYAALWLTISCNASAEDLSVLSETPDGAAPGKQLEIYLKQQFYEQLDDRRVEHSEVVGESWGTPVPGSIIAAYSYMLPLEDPATGRSVHIMGVQGRIQRVPKPR